MFKNLGKIMVLGFLIITFQVGCAYIRGINLTSTKQMIEGVPGVLFAGQKNICLVRDDNSEVQCSGFNDSWQIGNEEVSGAFVQHNDAQPVMKDEETKFLGQKVAIGKNFVVAIEKGASKKLWFWGTAARNILNTRLGIPIVSDSDPISATPFQFLDAAKATEISAADEYMCFTWNLRLKCIGKNNDGEFGADPHFLTESNSPYQISANATHFAATTGSLCWSEKQGNGTFNIKCNGIINHFISGGNYSTHVVATGLVKLSQIAISERTLCYLLDAGAAGTVYCMGGNQQGQMGYDPSNFTQSQDETLLYDAGVKTITGSSDGHFCATLTTGAAECWGRNNSGELGIALTNTYSFSPVPFVIPGKINQIVAVKCATIGKNETGTLGIIGSFNCNLTVGGPGAHGAGAHGAGSHGAGAH